LFDRFIGTIPVSDSSSVYITGGANCAELTFFFRSAGES
jgi:hypothetical protein